MEDAHAACPAAGTATDVFEALIPVGGATANDLEVHLDANAAGSGNTVTVKDSVLNTRNWMPVIA